jgi:hypothetical protein
MTIRDLLFASSIICMVIAGFTSVVTTMWLLAYFSSSKQAGSVRAIFLGGVITLVFAFVGLWLLFKTGILFL